MRSMNENLRILAFFLHSCKYGEYVGGAERRFLEITTRLKKLGVEMVALEYKPALAREWGYLSYSSIEIDRRFINHSILEAIRVTLHGIIECVKDKFDIIYVPSRGIFRYNDTTNLVSAYVVSLLFRKPLIVVFHHLTQSDYSCSYFNEIVKGQPQRHAQVCIAVSRATANDVIETFRVKRLIVSPNGVDLKSFRKLPSTLKLYDAVFFGRVMEEKGIPNLLKAWKIVTTQLPNAKLLLLGGSTPQAKETYIETINRVGLSRNVVLSDFVPDEEAIRLLNSSQIFVLPSKAEGFGLAIVEAMAVGLPCILSDIPALRENFHSAAVFVEPQNPNQLAQAILTLLSDPEKRKKLTYKGQKLVKQFSWDAVAEKELEILKSVTKH